MGLKILIIGFGSIGKKHADILKHFKEIASIHILTKHKCKKYIKINSLKEVKNLDPDYIIICTRTNLHFKYLKYLEKNFKNKIILVEKPLFHKNQKFNVKNNKVLVGYNLRFHPIIIFIKNFIKNKKILSSRVVCKSYLPNWRRNINYTQSNSAKKSFGGGVLLELSHEIDYVNWIFGDIKKIFFTKIGKMSNLKIDTEDHALIHCKTSLIDVQIELNFFSKIAERSINIDGNDFSLHGDLINNKVEIVENNNKKKILKYNIKKDETYIKEHKSILFNKNRFTCSFAEGKNVLKIIERIKRFKN